ncbi:cytochrome P450 alkane hydroxylase-like protein [Hypoxylon trugodes]|uniref:cytochrome P450 alkane hydroxylase-like protein n=1 Tax=Hypoxylon trugodes TaxID=326681 RepID=UPI00219F87AB|nr:cytochrome P450 alkane hydroxylase-like protein [Hypoxylon trugodes]KAI1386887.1 cytochrome P450 alkane hydroxylase-like protein [Hypoxylon trugodes]
MWRLIAAVLLLVIILLIWQRRQRDATRRQKCYEPLPQHQPFEPFMGLDFQAVIHQDISSLHRFHQRYGHSFQVNTLASTPSILTIHPGNVRVINVRDHDWGIQPARLPGMEFFCGRGFLAMDGDVWRYSRKLLRPSFNRSNLVDLSILSHEMDKLIENLPEEGTTVDLQPLFYIVFLNTSLHFLLGISDDKQDNAPCAPEEFVQSFHDALFFTGVRLVLGRIWNFLPQGKYLRACKTAHDYLNYHINQALNGEDTPQQGSKSSATRSLVQGLSSQTDDPEFIRSQIIQGMMASQETTSSLLGNTFFLLSQHPSYWQQIRTEVLEKGDDMLDFDTLLESKILQNVLLESLRLYPVFPLMGRTALRDTFLPFGGGPNHDAPIFVPRGTHADISYHALHRDPRVFGNDVESFRPERWDSITPRQWEFMGFGGGSRACLGRQKSLAEAAYVLARMAMKYGMLESRDGEEWKGEMKLTCKSANGCKVSLYKAGK